MKNTSRKRPLGVDSDEDDEPMGAGKKTKSKKKQDGRAEKVESILADLKQQHGTSFTPMQYRIWAEMVAGGVYASTDSHPTTSMFTRAGGTPTTNRKPELLIL